MYFPSSSIRLPALPSVFLILIFFLFTLPCLSSSSLSPNCLISSLFSFHLRTLNLSISIPPLPHSLFSLLIPRFISSFLTTINSSSSSSSFLVLSLNPTFSNFSFLLLSLDHFSYSSSFPFPLHWTSFLFFLIPYLPPSFPSPFP